MHSGFGILPSSYKRENQRQKEIFLIIKKLNYLEKSIKDKMAGDIYQDQVSNLLQKYKAASQGLIRFDLDRFSKTFGLEDQFYGIQLIKNPGTSGGGRSAMKILDLLHELDTKIAIDKPNNSAYVSEYKLLFSEMVDQFERLSQSQKLKLNDVYRDTVYKDYQEILQKQSNDLLEEIQLTIIQNNLFRFSQVFRRVIMS